MKSQAGTGYGWLAAVALALLVAMFALPLTGAAEGEGKWIKVEITEGEQTTPTVKVNVPLNLIEGLLDAVEFTEPTEGITVSKGIVVFEGNRIDLRKMIQELKKLPRTEFVTVEDGDMKVKVWIE
jgi:hypothetical protein